MLNTFQSKVKSRSGYDLFRQEKTQELRNEGLKGNQINTGLGELWRRFTDDDRQVFRRKVYLLDKLEETKDQNPLVRSHSVGNISKPALMQAQYEHSCSQ